MARKTILGCVILFAMLVSCSSKHNIIVGSKNFTEQLILGEITAQHLENRLHQPVTRRLNLGGTLLAHQALMAKEIDMYPEYTGTAYTNVLKLTPSVKDAAIILDRVRSEYASNLHLAWLNPLGFDNTFALTVRGSDARDQHLETLSDAAADRKGFNLGAGYEFLQRPDGYGALNQTYSINWTAAPKSMDLGLLYTALNSKQVSMVAGSSTDGMLSVLDVKVLKDDKTAFPAYQASIVARSELLDTSPDVRAALNELSGKIPNATMQKLNYEVDGKHRAVAEVAKEFLRAAGLAQ